MPDMFADTVGWGHLVDPTQAYHPLAASLYRSARQLSDKVLVSSVAKLFLELDRQETKDE